MLGFDASAMPQIHFDFFSQDSGFFVNATF